LRYIGQEYNDIIFLVTGDKAMNDAEKKVMEIIDAGRDDLIRIASDLIAVPSVSGKPGAGKYYEQMADYLDGEFAKIGIKGEKLSLPPGGTNFIASLQGCGHGRTLAMGGHYDVVPADEPEWETDPFKAEIRNGCLFGRGAADMKGGLAVCFMTMKALAECGVSLQGDVQFIASVDEETGGPYGIDYIAATGKCVPDMFINAEQTEMKIVTAFKGCAWLRVKVRGRSAHGGRPETGVNAVVKAAEIIRMLGSLDGREITYKRDPFLNGFSMNISCISGGQAVNAVPDECSFTVDCRFVPGQDYNEVINVIRGKIAEMSAADPDLDAEVEIISRCTNAVRFPADAELVEVLSQSIREATGHDGEQCGFLAAGDNGVFHRQGIPALVFGPGSPAVIHKANEYCNIDDMVEAAKIYALAAMRICGAGQKV
jgi:acetylornithine deacetylase/succinyl-diaminopimelate desuccinylase family protein